MTSNSDVVLDDLAKEINEHDQARRAAEVKGVMHALKIGELLMEAKRVVPHGKFIDWVKANTSVSQRMAQMYMTIAQDERITVRFITEYETVSHLTINKAVKLAREHERVEKYREKQVARIVELENASKTNLEKFAAGLAVIRSTFKEDGGDGAFKSWLIEHEFSKPFANEIPDLLDADVDFAFTEAFLADLEFRLSRGDNFDWLRDKATA